jgi:N-acetylglucosamine kinase-like BadF-type ATPase
VAAISGTGCVVNSSVRGVTRRVGGFGYLFEHCGSGYDMGRDAITAALRARNGTEEKTLLTDLVERELGGPAEQQLQALYRMSVSKIAGFAPLLLQAAEQKDPVALTILQRHSDYMANMIRTALSHDKNLRHVVFSGSTFCVGDIFFRMVAERLDPDLTLERLVFPPAWGACLQCAELCGLDAPKLENFLRT